MKFTISVLTAAANLAGLSAAARGMLEHCSSFTIEGLNGIQGHAIMLKASCQGIVSDLDINNCFGYVYFFLFFYLSVCFLLSTRWHQQS